MSVGVKVCMACKFGHPVVISCEAAAELDAMVIRPPKSRMERLAGRIYDDLIAFETTMNETER